jgi:hypothetical protein
VAHPTDASDPISSCPFCHNPTLQHYRLPSVTATVTKWRKRNFSSELRRGKVRSTVLLHLRDRRGPYALHHRAGRVEETFLGSSVQRPSQVSDAGTVRRRARPGCTRVCLTNSGVRGIPSAEGREHWRNCYGQARGDHRPSLGADRAAPAARRRQEGRPMRLQGMTDGEDYRDLLTRLSTALTLRGGLPRGRAPESSLTPTHSGE